MRYVLPCLLSFCIMIPLSAQTVNVAGTNELIVELVTDLYGEKRPTPADPNNRVGGRLERLDNGGVKIKLPAALWAFLGTVAAASIAGLVTLIVTFSG